MTTSHGLTRNGLRELKAELLRERAHLERSLGARLESDGSFAVGSFAPRAPAAADGGLALALETRTHARYGAILDALTRLASGTYGICVSCGDRIPYGRLIVMPEVARCLACGARA